jgi:hypothetical protein
LTNKLGHGKLYVFIYFVARGSLVLAERSLSLLGVSETCVSTLCRTPWTGAGLSQSLAYTGQQNTERRHALNVIRTHDRRIQAVKAHDQHCAATVVGTRVYTAEKL